MKKFLLMVFILPTLLFSYDITFSKKFAKTVSSDLLTTYVNISVEDKEEAFISKNIEKFNNYIKKNDDVIKKNGSFTISPIYKYYKDRQEFLGYKGSIRYTIKSKSAKKLNKFIDDLISLKEKLNEDKIKLNISNVSWVISDKLYTQKLDELRLDAIVWIDKYTKSLSSTIDKRCRVKAININSSNMNRPYLRSESMAYSAKAIADVAPMNTSKDVQINPNFVLECK